jgi:hypothetical protein
MRHKINGQLKQTNYYTIMDFFGTATQQIMPLVRISATNCHLRNTIAFQKLVCILVQI